MTNQQLKTLEKNLWDSANSLRAYGGIKAADYAVPVLGLIFLKFADNKYSLFEEEIIAQYEKDKGARMEEPIDKIALAKCGFYLPKHARYNYLLELPSDTSLAKAIELAMVGNKNTAKDEGEKLIYGLENYLNEAYEDLLPTRAYTEIEQKKKDILPQLLKSFSDIPKDASGDVFGKIYEYFLGKFAMSEGQKGGEFFTPTSVVRFIVEVIEPFKGKLYDPACGSGGMFVQSATFLRKTKHDLNDIYVQGQEYMGETVRLAKMNLLVNNLRGEIKEVNSYENNPYDSYGKFDYVMANPPFNVKSVKEATVKGDERFYHYGLPKNKGKKDDKITDANYLWISLFATSLNENGRAGFVMPNSASDARNSEYEMRKKLVDSGIVDCMVSMPSNMFFTVTLPATLWFFDKKKAQSQRKDKILFLDARNVYRQIDRAHREWTEENQQNLATIVRLYRGDNHRFLELVNSYILKTDKSLKSIPSAKANLEKNLKLVFNSLEKYSKSVKESKTATFTAKKKQVLEETDFYNKLANFAFAEAKNNEDKKISLQHELAKTPQENKAQQEAASYINWQVKQEAYNAETLKNNTNALSELWKIADSNLKQKNDKTWAENSLSRADKALEEALFVYTEAKEKADYWHENIEWLQTRFPEAKYQDVTGLCKMADKTEYADEQDYSLNAGRYVGVVIEDDKITEEEFRSKFNLLKSGLIKLNKEANLLMNQIENTQI